MRRDFEDISVKTETEEGRDLEVALRTSGVDDLNEYDDTDS